MTSRNFLPTLVLLFFVAFTVYRPAFAQSTAQSGFAEVLTIAQAEAPDATFLGLIGDDLSPTTGESSSWLYVFESTDSENIFGILRSDGELSEPLSLTEFPADIADIVTPGAIPSTWLDSNQALSVAEDNGGAAFRSTYSEVNVSAALIGIPSTELLDLDVPPIPALWVFTYTSLDEDSFAATVHIVDAIFGFHIQLEPTTARYNLDTVEDAAGEFSNDAKLVSVSTLLPDFDSNGKASVWIYTYYSESLEEGMMVFAASGLALGSTPMLKDPVSAQPLPENWFDSPYAAQNVDIDTPLSDIVLSPSLIQARVSNGLSDDQPEFAFWQLNYLLFDEDILDDLLEDPSLEDFSIESFLIGAEDIPVLEQEESAFSLIDADTDQAIEGFDPIQQDAILDLGFLPKNVNITVVFDSPVEQVDFELNGEFVNAEQSAPYALFGDNQGDFNAGALPVQKHVLRAIPTINGTTGDAREVVFEVVNSLVPSISSLLLVDAASNLELFEFNDGAAISLSDLPVEVNLIARTNERVKSVLFDLNNGFYKRLENVPPYAFFGDANGDFFGGKLPVGGHELVVTPYSDVMKGGEAGPERVIRFTILEATASKSGMQSGYYIEPLNGIAEDVPGSFVLHDNYPNPFNPTTSIAFDLPESSNVQINVYDTLGRLVRTLTDATYEAGQHEVKFDAAELTSGLYIYQLVTPRTVVSKKMMFLK